MPVLALNVISNKVRNLQIITRCRLKIPRLSPRNDITTKSQRTVVSKTKTINRQKRIQKAENVRSQLFINLSTLMQMHTTN